MTRFQMPMSAIEKLWSIYCAHETPGQGYLLTEEFFNNILCYEQRSLTDPMVKLIDSKSDVSMTFGEFVEIVVTFACFEKRELLKYLFHVLDPHQIGLIERTELKHFVNNMWRGEATKNVTEGLHYLDRINDGDGQYNWKQIESMDAHYPSAFYPLYHLQICIIDKTMGRYWWEEHKNKLYDKRKEYTRDEEKRLRLKEEEERKEKEVVNEEMVLRRMGYVRYYCMPWMRHVYKARLLRIAVMEEELDQAYASKHTREH
eukprot:CAMPEP_0184992914 /NCGR_PEP_ID=MMETSP1098-20130426/43134_1 /TAXON_ID=89044 /ORGANISM="Spumella elongata, Strain CCAP 955/1" /LENGTH=258 /DNA_ID=CAMNT_0027518637 /DNA_START=111 /DNA_END=887 /DNA_ORIENTATION=+